MKSGINPVVAVVVIIVVIAIVALIGWKMTSKKQVGNTPERAGQGMREATGGQPMGDASAPTTDEGGGADTSEDDG